MWRGRILDWDYIWSTSLVGRTIILLKDVILSCSVSIVLMILIPLF
jgi:hypothetical protein